MNITEKFNPKNSLELFGLNEYFDNLRDLIFSDNFPKVLLFSGDKGLGKSTLINHFLHFFYDRDNYNLKALKILKESKFHSQFLDNIFPNIIYLSGSEHFNVKIDDIRIIKNKLLQTPIDNNKRFIIFDDVDLFNVQSLNALLKIIEEPGNYNHFILINNNKKALLDTLKSRCLEIKMFINQSNKLKITTLLSKKFNQNILFDIDTLITSPGNLIKYNFVLEQNKIDLNLDYLSNLKTLINLYKKEKNNFYKELIYFFTDYHFCNLKKQKSISNEEFISNHLNVKRKINDFFVFNLSHNFLINSLEGNIFNG